MGVADSPIINVDEKVSLSLSKVDDRFMICGGLVIEYDLVRTGLCQRVEYDSMLAICFPHALRCCSAVGRKMDKPLSKR